MRRIFGKDNAFSKTYRYYFILPYFSIRTEVCLYPFKKFLLVCQTFFSIFLIFFEKIFCDSKFWLKNPHIKPLLYEISIAESLENVKHLNF